MNPIDFVQKAQAIDGATTKIINTPSVVNETVVVTPQNSAPEIIKKNNPIGTFSDLRLTDKYYTAISYFAKK